MSEQEQDGAFIGNPVCANCGRRFGQHYGYACKWADPTGSQFVPVGNEAREPPSAVSSLIAQWDHEIAARERLGMPDARLCQMRQQLADALTQDTAPHARTGAERMTDVLLVKAALEGSSAVGILEDIHARTGGWFDCECGSCIEHGDDFHAWEAFEDRAREAIHYACLVLAEQDAVKAERFDALRASVEELFAARAVPHSIEPFSPCPANQRIAHAWECLSRMVREEPRG